MHKKLTRDIEHKMLGGVLAGLAKYFNQDPTLWRLVFVFVLFLTGVVPLVFVYIIAWIIMPVGSGVDYEVVD